MSALEYYLEKGFTPQNKTVTLSGLGTAAVWTPSTSTRVVVTDLVLSPINAGTVAFYWGNLAGTKIAEFVLSGSANIPISGHWVDDTYDRILYAKLGGASGTDAVRINFTGFELP